MGQNKRLNVKKYIMFENSCRESKTKQKINQIKRNKKQHGLPGGVKQKFKELRKQAR